MVDFFISYNKSDRNWAEWIAWQLEQAGYSTILDALDFRPGSNFALEIWKAAAESDRTIAVLSPDYVSSRFSEVEWSAALARDPINRRGTLLPVRVRECELPQSLLTFTYIDLVGRSEATQKTRVPCNAVPI
jgi:TIR domain